MGCSICSNNANLIKEEEFITKNQNIPNIEIPSTSDNKLELKTKIDALNLNNNKDSLSNDHNNKNNCINICNNNNIKKINENIIISNKHNSSNIENKNSIDIKNIINESNNKSSNKNDYNTRVIDLINEIRTNPPRYANIILENMQYISKEIKIKANEETGQHDEIEEIYFLKKVKVRLSNGKSAFLETAEQLKYMKPMEELLFKDEIKLIMPKSEEEMNDNSFVKKQLIEKRKNNNINAFFKDGIKNPEVGVLLMIIGDYNNTQNKKRNAILNREYKYIAVNSRFLGDLFIAYYTFSK